MMRAGTDPPQETGSQNRDTIFVKNELEKFHPPVKENNVKMAIFLGSYMEKVLTLTLEPHSYYHEWK
jgi:hypothetical protein